MSILAIEQLAPSTGDRAVALVAVENYSGSR